MKLSGNTTMKPIPCIASAERTSIPKSTPAQVNATTPSMRSAARSSACPALRCGSQPSASPKPTTIVIPRIASQTWPITCAVMIARRPMGRERKRSTTPSIMSLEVATPAPIVPNASDWPMMPGKR